MYQPLFQVFYFILIHFILQIMYASVIFYMKFKYFHQGHKLVAKIPLKQLKYRICVPNHFSMLFSSFTISFRNNLSSAAVITLGGFV